MSRRLSITKCIIAAGAYLAIGMHAGSSSAAIANAAADSGRQLAKKIDLSFIGGIPLRDGEAAVAIHLGEVAEYSHLLSDVSLAVPGAAPAAGIDAIETGSIVAGVFNSVAIPIRSFPVSKRWVRIMHGITECAAPGSCDGKSKLLGRISQETRGKTLVETIGIVNAIVNSTLRYRGDQSLYKKLDYWATPSEILARASGDCEDFAIMKMTGLMRAGVPAESLSLVVLRDNGRGVFHAVLAVTTSSGSFILDNARAKVAMDRDLPNYQPLYSLSGNRAWIHGTKAANHPAVADSGDFSAIAPGEGFAESGDDASQLQGLDLPLRPGFPAVD
jgi:predicted transglutaminase-like cysteine proteinase